MEDETSSGLAGKQNDDVEVDHYFLPGGILDTHQEEDMIGGSLLDEIGGVGNVTAVSVNSVWALLHSVLGVYGRLSLDRPLSTICLGISLIRDLLNHAAPRSVQLLPAKQMTVSRIVGSDALTVASADGTLRPQQLHRKSASVISASPT